MMTLVIDLPQELENELSAEANRLGLALPEYALRVLSMWGSVGNLLPYIDDMPQTGVELVAYWQREGLIGTRPDIADSQEHARVIRAKAEHRERTTH